MRHFFEARSVAVIGASRTHGKHGFHTVDNIGRAFTGDIYPINPHADRIAGHRCYGSLDEVPRPVDLAILLRPPQEAEAVFEVCIDLGIPAVLIPASGFAEASPDGQQIQARIVERARATGTAVWGPNCGGFVNTANGLHASISELGPVRAGGVGIVAQSGVYVAGVFNQYMANPRFGVSIVATLGNACDVSPADVLDYLASDPATKVIALHLEGLRDGERLLRAARSIAGVKPVIAALPGATVAGAQASRTHTGNLAVDKAVARGLLAQAGIVPAREFTDLLDLAHAFTVMESLKSARRVAVISTSGAATVICADCIDEAGLTLAQFSPSTQARLDALHPLTWGVQNPIDAALAMETHGTAKAISEFAEAVLEDPAVDAAVFAMGAYGSGSSTFDPVVIGPARESSGKPVVAWLYGPERDLGPWRASFEAIGIPTFRELERAIGALAGHERIYHCSARPVARATPGDIAAVAPIITTAKAAGRDVLTELDGLRLLHECGIDTVEQMLAADEARALEAAAGLGYPVVLKAISPDLPHKSDSGAVVTGIAAEDEMRDAWQRVTSAVHQIQPAPRLDGMLIQRMVGGREVIVGFTPAPGVGPVVMVGCGGIRVEVQRAVAFRLPPIDEEEADEMIEESGVGKLIAAYRGRGAGDRAALRHVLVRVATLAVQQPDLMELEVNPLMVLDEGVVAVDALATLHRYSTR